MNAPVHDVRGELGRRAVERLLDRVEDLVERSSRAVRISSLVSTTVLGSPAIINYAKREYKLLIGQQTAEELKASDRLGLPDGRGAPGEIRGRDMVAGLPRRVVADERGDPHGPGRAAQPILDAVKERLDRTAARARLGHHWTGGIIAPGGGALLQGLDERLREETQMPAHRPSRRSMVAVGSGRSLRSSRRSIARPEIAQIAAP